MNKQEVENKRILTMLRFVNVRLHAIETCLKEEMGIGASYLTKLFKEEFKTSYGISCEEELKNFKSFLSESEGEK